MQLGDYRKHKATKRNSDKKVAEKKIVTGFCCRAKGALAPGGSSLGKCIPLLGWHCETPTLNGTKFAKPYPYLIPSFSLLAIIWLALDHRLVREVTEE